MMTFKRKLILNEAQKSRIDSWINTSRFLYNMCLEIKIAAWRNRQEQVHKYGLSEQLTDIRDIDWIKDTPRECLEDVIKRVDKAYKNFFRGSNFPKFATKRWYQSIQFNQNIRIGENRIKIPKIGWLKIFSDTEIVGEIRTAIIKKEITGYFICITTDAVKSIQCQDENQVLGIDMGITHFAVGSNGHFISNPRHFKAYERKLRIENRSLARKRKGGKNWIKQAKRLSLLHHKIANVRADFLHKHSTWIAEANHTVFVEDLNVSGMSRNRKLSKHILDCGWSMFRRMLEYKTNVVSVNPKYTSQTCFNCGHQDAASRVSQAVFKCTNCGIKRNADLNAALTILSKGIALTRQRNAIA